MDEQPSCPVSIHLLVPRLERAEKDLDNLHTIVRDVFQGIQNIHLIDKDFDRRIASLENIYSEQKRQNTIILTDVELLKSSVQDLREKMISVVDGLNIIAKKFDEQRQDMINISVKDNINHSRRIKATVTIAGFAAAITIILNQIYSAITGENVLSSLFTGIKFFFSS